MTSVRIRGEPCPKPTRAAPGPRGFVAVPGAGRAANLTDPEPVDPPLRAFPRPAAGRRRLVLIGP
jgi:hypothetical protein